MPDTFQPLGKRSQVILVLTAFVLLLLYAVQVFTPLRLHTDGVRYLSIASDIVDGINFPGFGSKVSHPVGYPYLIALLEVAVIANNHVFVALNILFGVLGLYFFSRVMLEERAFGKNLAFVVSILTALSWIVVKNITLAVPEFLYLAVTGFTLYVFHLSLRRPWYLALGVILMAWAILIRTIGVALVPAFICTLFWVAGSSEVCMRVFEKYRKIVMAVGAVSAVFFLACVFFIIPHRYFVNVISQMDGMFFQNLITARSLEIGEVVFNLPASKVPWRANLLIGVVGVGLLCILGYGLFKRHVRSWRPVDVYMASYLGILLIWPVYAPRFWLPVIPLVWMYIFEAAGRWKILRSRFLVPTYIYFVVTGVLALGYSTRITLAGDRFSKLHGGGSFQDPYEFAVKTNLPVSEYEGRNRGAVILIRRYQAGVGEDAGRSP